MFSFAETEIWRWSLHFVMSWFTESGTKVLLVVRSGWSYLGLTRLNEFFGTVKNIRV